MSCSSPSCAPERRRLLRQAAALATAPLLAGVASASGVPESERAPAEVERALEQAQVQGRARLRMFGFQVYDARLWRGPAAVSGEAWDTVPHALEIAYLRKLKGAQIAERSLIEMRRQRELAPDEAGRWLKAMQAAFPDVQPGDRIVGVLEPGTGLRFYVNGRRSGEVREPEFARLFSGIWLAPQTSQPELRQVLLGARR
jgi:hypothetical protein